MSDLLERLVEAATDTLRNQEAAIGVEAGHLKSVTIEIELSAHGAVIDSRSWLERRGAHRLRRRREE